MALSVWDIVTNSYLTLWCKGWHFLRLSWLWAGLLFVIAMMTLLIGKAAQMGLGIGANANPVTILLFFVIMNIVLWLAIASIATGWHRLIQNINPPQKSYYLAMDVQVWRYLGSIYLFGMIGAFTLYPVIMLSHYVLALPTSPFEAPLERIILGAFGFIWLWSGFSLLLPAVAVGDNHISFLQIARLGKGNRLKLVLIQFIPLIIGLLGVFGLLSISRHFPADSQIALWLFLLMILVVLASWLVYLSALSLTYQVLSKRYFPEEAKI